MYETDSLSGGPAAPGGLFAARLNHLFATVRDGRGRPYSVRAVAAELTRRGVRISHTQLGRLRQGEGAGPRREVIEALAGFFGCDPGFFLAPAADGQQEELLRVLADANIRKVATRLAAAQLSPEGTAAVIAMIEHVRKLEQAAETRSAARPSG